MRGICAFAAAVALWAVLAAVSVEPVTPAAAPAAHRATTVGRLEPPLPTAFASEPVPAGAAVIEPEPAAAVPLTPAPAATVPPRDVAPLPSTTTTTTRPASPPAPPPPPPPPPILAFDTCEAPPLASLQAWRSSPYRGVGIYIGGQMRHCRNAALDTRDWLDAVVAQGWYALPIYVGPQAPCTRFWTTMDGVNATAQGLAVGDDAVARAAALGMPRGAPIYYDLEAYEIRDPSCDQVVKAFLHAFVVRLHERGYVAGLYSSLNSGIRAHLAAIANPAIAPFDAIWVASWDDQVTTYGLRDFPDSAWSNRQRVKQYAGDHKESWGGVEMEIDSNLVDAPVYPAR